MYKKIGTLLVLLTLSFNLSAQITPKQASQAELAVNTDCINIYPNPTTGSFSIDRYVQNYSIKVLSLNGTLLLDFSKQSNPKMIDLSHLPNGIYYIAVTSNSSSDLLCVQKVIKID